MSLDEKQEQKLQKICKELNLCNGYEDEDEILRGLIEKHFNGSITECFQELLLDADKRYLLERDINKESSEKYCAFHFCSWDVFEKILNSGIIRLSKITQSNDPDEIELCVKSAEKDLKKFLTKKAENDHIADIKRKEIEELHLDSGLEVFALCFALNWKSIMHWRAYADNEKGVAIGLVRKELANFCENSLEKYRLSEVQYKDKDDVLKLNFLKIARFNCVASQNMDFDNYKNSLLDLYKNFLAVNQEFFVKTKSSYYTSEQETRLYLAIKKEDIKDYPIISEEKDGHNREYIEIKLQDMLNFSKSVSDLFKEIYLGPNCNKSVDEVEVLLKNKLKKEGRDEDKCTIYSLKDGTSKIVSF